MNARLDFAVRDFSISLEMTKNAASTRQIALQIVRERGLLACPRRHLAGEGVFGRMPKTAGTDARAPN